MKMKAVILDIDGTLLDTSVVDNRLYMAAVQQVVGKVSMRNDWSDYTHVTDSGILGEIIADNAVAGDKGAFQRVKETFVDQLKSHIERQGPFTEIPGARAFVQRLSAAPDKKVAYATGGWSVSARLKLESAGFPLTGIPLASCDEFPDRVSIMQHALKQLNGSFENVCYYGDGVWDQTAARRLGWKFIAVGHKLGGINHFKDSED